MSTLLTRAPGRHSEQTLHSNRAGARSRATVLRPRMRAARLRGRGRTPNLTAAALLLGVAVLAARASGQKAGAGGPPKSEGHSGSVHGPAPWTASATERSVFSEDFPNTRGEFEIGSGDRLYFACGAAYYVYSRDGKFEQKRASVGTAEGLAPLAGGGFIAAQSGGRGHVALLRSDGSEAKVLVARGDPRTALHSDSTGWTNPNRLAIDESRGLVVVVDTTQAHGSDRPAWSRLAIFDMAGHFRRDLLRYDATEPSRDPALETWYDDLEVDPPRQRILVTARRGQELRVYDYEGKLLKAVPGIAGVAVFGDGRVAVGSPDKRHVDVFAADFSRLARLDVLEERDLEVDSQGRLLASVADPTTLVLRWNSQLTERTVLPAHFSRILVEPLAASLPAGRPLEIRMEPSGYPSTPPGEGQAWVRPSDGSQVAWRRLEGDYRQGRLSVLPPASLRGPYELAIRYGSGPMPSVRSPRELIVSSTTTFVPDPERPKAGLVSRSARSAFRQGENISFRVVWSAGLSAPTGFALQPVGEPEHALHVAFPGSPFVELPPATTARLPPGSYELVPEGAARENVPFRFDLAPSEPDSPMQRILYHEFDQTPATSVQPKLRDRAERVAFIGAYLAQLKNLGFNRETDRSGLKLLSAPPGRLQPADTAAADVFAGYFAPLGGRWEPDVFLDRAVALGIRYDTQVLGHCASVPLADGRLEQLGSSVRRLSQWLGKYPSFYGFNFNDELFFDNVPFSEMPEEDRAWLKQYLADHPRAVPADAYRAGLERLYARLVEPAKLGRPGLNVTATPMWQYPAEEGSYAPSVYAKLSETYAHYLSEGFDWSFSAPHSVDMLRRPGLPLMGVFDNGFNSLDGEGYLKNAMLVLGRGVQGVGVSHSRPFQDARAADAFRVANEVARRWGPVFAQATPDNEGSILYSYTQDISEKRHLFGTPHWERVFALYGAALVAKLPMNIVYEEDLAAGRLLEGGKPRVPLLFLVGQRQTLPPRVWAAVEAFRAAGGRLVTDTASAPLPGATRLELPLEAVFADADQTLDSDAIFPASQPAYQSLAEALRAALAARRRWAVDVDDPWTVVNRFRSGDVRYVLLAQETGPHDQAAGDLWALGGSYNGTYQPRVSALTLPATGAVYDVFEQRRLDLPVASAARAPSATHPALEIAADLRAFPGRLYAVLPKGIPEPALDVVVGAESVEYRVDAGVAGGVPLRIRLLRDGQPLLEQYRLTSTQGRLAGSLGRPLFAGEYRLEVTELLGGRAASVKVEGEARPPPFLVAAPDHEIENPPALRRMVGAKAAVRLLLPEQSVEREPRVARFVARLRALGHAVNVVVSSDPPIAAGISVAVALVDSLDGLAVEARRRGLLPAALGRDDPGPGRSKIVAISGLRDPAEDVALVLAGDRSALFEGLERLASSLTAPAPRARVVVPVTQARLLHGQADSTVPRWALGDHVGARLVDVRAAGERVAVISRGPGANLVVVEDGGSQGKVIESARLGEGPDTNSLFLSADARTFGGASRTVASAGEALFLKRQGTPNVDVFGAFGDLGRVRHQFAVAPDGGTVLAPGQYGVVAWHREGTGWKEVWDEPYYLKFDGLDWPVAPDQERQPWFEPHIPSRGSVALIAFGELTKGAPNARRGPSGVAVTARALTNGKMLWRYERAASGGPAFPTLHANSDGSLVLLEVQLGAGREPSYEFDLLAQGKLVASWSQSGKPVSVGVTHDHVLIASSERELQLRDVAGRVVYDRILEAQPTSVLLDDDSAAATISLDSGWLERLDVSGARLWRRDLGVSAALAQSGNRLYAAGWDGRLRALELGDGAVRYSLDLTPAVLGARAASRGDLAVHTARRPHPTTALPATGANFLRDGRATLSVGGTRGWKSRGSVQISAALLTDGQTGECPLPWLSESELYWDAVAGRQVWAEVDFAAPSHVSSLTVYEDPRFPDSFPRESQIEVWNEQQQVWQTVKHATFLEGPINTYALNLNGVRRLRYLPWSNYFHNFHTSEIEVR